MQQKMYNDIMEDIKDYLFNFNNISYSKFPSEVLAKFCFEEELIEIPDTDAFLKIEKNNWFVLDDSTQNMFSMSNDQFLDIYIASNKKTQRYLEFILDSFLNEYSPVEIEENFNFFEEIFGDIIEKPAPIKNKWKLVWDLITNKKIYITKYF